MVVPMESIHRSVSGMENRFSSLEDQVRQLFQELSVQQLVANGNSHEIVAAEATCRLVAKPAALRDLLDATNVQASEMAPAIKHDATHFGGSVSTRTYTRRPLSCLCRHRRRPQSKKSFWGSLILWSKTATEQHTTDCPATQVIVGTKRSGTAGLTYTGLRNLASIALQISFSMSSGAKAFSLSPNFTYYPTVDSKTAPVFRILSEVVRGDRREEVTRMAVSTILGLFRAKKASPRAVDANNRSLVYYVAECINMGTDRCTPIFSKQAKPGRLLELLECLLDNEAPAYHYDLSGGTPISRLFTSLTYHSITNPLVAGAANLILRSNTDGDVACLSKPYPAAYSTIVNPAGREWSGDGNAILLHFLAGSAQITEAYGCGPLSLAILSNDLEQVQQLAANHRPSLAERNLFGHTPLHLASDRPLCMRILVKETSDEYLNQVDEPGEFGMSALETALFLSGSRCRENETRQMCEGCECAECAAILLEAGCAVPVSACLQSVLSCASERCRQLYVRHMKDRRDRLKELALTSLSAMRLRQLGHTSEGVLDSAASQVIQVLRDHGIGIPEALTVTRNGPSSVYRALCKPEDAELFFRAGFYDTDSWCNANQAELGNIRTGLSYLHWLATHGANSCQFKSFETPRAIFMANFTFWTIDEDLSHCPENWIFNNELRFGPLSDFGSSSSSASLPLSDRIAWIHEVNTAVLPATIADNCCCKCSPGGCTPLSSLLKGIPNLDTYTFEHERSPEQCVHEETQSAKDSIAGDEDGTEFSDDMSVCTWGSLSEVASYFTDYLEVFGGDLEIRHHTAALRYMTFTALGIRHTCCDPYESRMCGYESVCGDDLSLTSEEMAEIEEEIEEEEEEEHKERYAHELGLLEELLEEFEAELIAILQDSNSGAAGVIRFWKRIWVSRMSDVLDHLDGDDLGDDLGDDERRGAEEAGVKWDLTRPPKGSEVTDNPYEIYTLEWYKYKLEKIVAECE